MNTVGAAHRGGARLTQILIDHDHLIPTEGPRGQQPRENSGIVGIPRLRAAVIYRTAPPYNVVQDR